MATLSRPLGRRTDPSFPIPQYNNWKTDLRTVTLEDASPDSVPLAEHIMLDKDGERDGSRFSLCTITLLCKLAGDGAEATITLYAKEGVDFYLIRQDSVSVNSVLQYKDLPPLRYVPVVTALTGTLVLHGGGTM